MHAIFWTLGIKTNKGFYHYIMMFHVHCYFKIKVWTCLRTGVWKYSCCKFI